MIELGTAFEDFLNEKGFILEETKRDGRLLIYLSFEFQLRIGEDYNGSKWIDIKRKGNDFQWIELILLMSYILKKDDYLPGIPFDAVKSFFMESFDNILKLLDDDSYSSTLLALQTIKHKRAQFLFGSKSGSIIN